MERREDERERHVLDEHEGKKVRDAANELVGELADIYFDDDTGQPEWGLVRSGFLGRRRAFVPLVPARATMGQEIRLTVTKAEVESAPAIDDDGELSQAEEQRLAEHYGLRWSTERSSTGLPDGELIDLRRPSDLTTTRWVVADTGP